MASEGRRKQGVTHTIVRILPFIAIALLLTAGTTFVLFFVLGVPIPGRPAPGQEEPPAVSFTWVRSDNLPTNRDIVTSDVLKDYQDVVNAARADGNGTLPMTEARFDALSRLLDQRCMQAHGGPCITVLYDQGQYFIMLLG